MPDTLHADERAMYVQMVRRRVCHLARLLQSPHDDPPPSLLGMGVWQLLKAAIPLCGDELRSQFYRWLGMSLRNQSGLCPFCGDGKKAANALMCQTCADENTAFDQQHLLHSADERRPQ